MELKQYAKILRRRWLLILIPAVVVLAIGLATYQKPGTTYNAGLRFIVAQPPGVEAAMADEQRYYNWLSSEYIVNGLADWARGGAFAQAVVSDLAIKGYSVPPGAIQGGIATDNARSMLTVSLTYGETNALAAMMESVATVLTTQNADALPQLGETAVLVQLDPIHVNQISTGIRNQLDLPIRLALALGAGIGLALLVEYLDPTLRDRREVEAAGLIVLGEIPKK